jgi:hypothetical protein
MISHHNTHQNTARIARTAVNVAVCRTFSRSVLTSISTRAVGFIARNPHIATAGPTSEMGGFAALSGLQLSRGRCGRYFPSFPPGSLIVRCSLGSQPDNENAYILLKASLMDGPRGLHESVCKLPKIPLPRRSIHKDGCRESMWRARSPLSCAFPRRLY